MVLRRAARVPHLFLIAGSFLTLSIIPESSAQERPLHGDQSDAANRIPWPVYPHSGQSQFQAFPQPQPRFPQSILPPSFIKVINAVGSPDWETTTTTSSGAASSTTLTTTPSTTTTSTTTTTQPPPVTSVALSSVEVRAPEVDPLSPSAWKAVQDQPQVPKRRRFQQIKRRRKPRPKEEDIKHFGENRNPGTQPPGTTAYPRTSRTTRRQPSTALIRGYRSKAPQVAPPTTTKRPFPRFPNGLKKFSPTPRWPTLTTSTTTTTTSTTSTRKPFIFGERRVPSWYGQTTPTTPRPPPTTTVPKLHKFGPNSNLRYKNDDLIKGPLARLRPPLRRSAIVRDTVPQTIEKDELELSQSIQTPNGRRRVTYTAPPRRYQAKNQHGQEQFPPHLMVNRTERGGQQGRSEPSDEVGEVVRFVAIPHFVGGTIPSRRADFREGGRAPLRRMYRPPFSMPGRRRFPFPGPVAVYPQSLASLEDSSQDEETPIRIPVPRPAGPYPLLPPPPGLPIRVLRQPYSSNAGGPPTNVVQEQQQQQQQHPVRTNPVPPAFPRPLGSLGNANLHGRMNSKPEEPRCDRFSEDICLDDFEYPSAAILDTISRQRAKFDAMYAEVRDRSPQVEGVTRKEEERYTMHHYFGADRDTRKDPRDYAQDGGFLCPSEILYERPRRARNHVGVWKVIINIAEYRQTMRLEKCLRPGRSCSYVLDKYSSSCNQVYSYQRLLTFEKGKGLHIDIFKVPSGCSCHVKGFSQYTRNDEYQPPYEYDKAIYSSASAPTSKETVEQRNSNISKTLWIILGNGKEIDQETKDRLVQQLKQYPQLAEQFPQADAIRQLINEAEETDYRRQAPRPDRRRPPYGAQYIKSKPKEEPAYHPTRPPPPQHWSQTSSTPDGPYYTSTSSFRRPPHAADFDGEEVLPHGARPRFYQRPFKSSEEDVLFTRSTGDTRIVVLRPRDPLPRRYHKPARDHSSAGRPAPHAEQVDRISHGPSSRGDVLLVEPVRQRPYGKRFQVVTTTEPSTTRDVAKKINFSYHPIIDYITK